MVRPPMPEAPTPRPLIPGPQKQQPLRIQGDSEGPQGTGGTPSTPGKASQLPEAEANSSVKKTTTNEPSTDKPKSLDELRVVNPKKTGDFSDISGKSVQEVLSRVPEGATMRKLTPVEGGSKVGVEYKWVDENGVTNRLRIHDADPSAPVGSNASQGWVARYQVGQKYYDPEVDGFRPRNVHKPESPHYDPKAANDTHIPIETPDESVTDLMRFQQP
jgi:Bacterial toxin 30